MGYCKGILRHCDLAVFYVKEVISFLIVVADLTVAETSSSVYRCLLKWFGPPLL